MTTTEETRQVLEMLSQGKVSVQEAEQLLQAVAAATNGGEKRADPKYFRVTVTQPAMEGKKSQNVNIRIPMTVVRGGLRLGALIPTMIPKKKIHLSNGTELDLSKITYEDLEGLIKDIGELTVDVDDEEGKQVRIRCE